MIRFRDVHYFAFLVACESLRFRDVDLIYNAPVVNQHVARCLGLSDAVDFVHCWAVEFHLVFEISELLGRTFVQSVVQLLANVAN